MLELGKLLTWLVSPMTLAFLGFVVALVCLARGRRRAGGWLGAATLAWLLAWSMPALGLRLGYGLEKDYPPQAVEDLPAADAIVLLGGGMTPPVAPLVYPELLGAGDRAWHAARLYRAGKAPVVIPSGVSEERASVPFLRDLGVPAEAIRVEGASRNTDENARFTAALLARLGGHRVLLVTSAWHMRRARLLFERAGVDVIPAAADYEATLAHARAGHWSLQELLPNPETLCGNTVMLKEYIGYWVYRTVK